MSAETTAEKQQVKRVVGRPFEPGQSGNPKGRPKSSRHKLAEDFIQAMQSDFEQNGPGVIAKVREEKPDQYLKVIASILPKELNVKTGALDELDDSELAGLLDAVRSVATELATREARSGAKAPSVGEPASKLQTLQ